MPIILPLYESIVEMHNIVLMVSGGKRGIKNKSLILGAVDRPKTYLAYQPDSDIHTICALLLDSIARNHGFDDGNKRTGLMTALYTYRVNGYYLNFNLYANKEFEELALWVVVEKPEIPEVAAKLQELADKYRTEGEDGLADKLRAWFNSS